MDQAHHTIVLLVLAFAWSTGILAQTVIDAPESASDDSQQVEVSEDNYRRFMELDDRNLERRALPPIAYARPDGLEKMQNLPEASQRHLRDQLREVILKGGRWTPADADKVYPYVPSPDATRDASLRADEAAAWDELVAEYHEREAAIHTNAARSKAASIGASGTETEDAEGSQSGSDKAVARQASTVPIDALDANGPASSPDSDNGERRDNGVSQNALEYLTLRHAGDSATGEASPGGTQNARSEGSPASASASDSTQAADSPGSRQDSASPPQPAPETMTAQRQAPSSQEESTSAEGDPAEVQRALNEVIFLSPGTLSVEELANARGLGGPRDEDGDDEDDRKD